MDGVGEHKARKMTTNGVLVIQTASLSPSQFFFVSIQLWSLWQKSIHHTYCSPSFSLWLISPNDFGSSANVVGDVFGKISIFSRWWWPSQRKRKGSLWNPITQRPGLFYCHQQSWPISSMATVSNNCSHTNSIAVARLAQGVDIKLNFHLKVIA